MHYTKIIVIFAVTKLKSIAMETTKTDKKMKRYKLFVWVWLILTVAAYINAVIDIINVIRKLWE